MQVSKFDFDFLCRKIREIKASRENNEVKFN